MATNEGIQVADFNATFDSEKGEWTYEQKKTKKKDGRLKKKYHDMPRFKAILEYEGAMKKEYQSVIVSMVKDTIKYLKNA